MATERSTRKSTGKPGLRSDDTAAPRPGTEQSASENRHVDFDPWAMLLEGLMDMPEEVPAERKRPKGK